MRIEDVPYDDLETTLRRRRTELDRPPTPTGTFFLTTHSRQRFVLHASSPHPNAKLHPISQRHFVVGILLTSPAIGVCVETADQCFETSDLNSNRPRAHSGVLQRVRPPRGCAIRSIEYLGDDQRYG